MATQNIAQGLSSLGRYGDSTLVHMQPHEVAGLQALAQSQGTSLTINPETGLPEAFNLGGFFRSLLPTIAGAGLSIASGGALSPLAIGLITGGVTAAATGDLKQGIMGGLGGYGGAGLGSSIQGFGAAAPAANTSVNTAATAADQVGKASAVASAGDTAVQNELAQAALMRSGQAQAANAIKPGIDFANVSSGGPGIFSNTASQPVNFNALYGAKPVVGSGAGVNLSGQMATNLPASGVMNQPTLLSGAKGFEQAGSGISRAFENPGAYADYAGGTTKALTSVGMPLAGAALGGLEMSDIYGDPMQPDTRGKYDPYASLNLNTDTGLKLYAQGGPVSFADGGDTGKDPAGLPGGGLGALQGAGMLPLDVSDINAKYGIDDQGGLVPAPKLGLFADNDQIESARTAYETQLKSAMTGRNGMGTMYQSYMGMGGMNQPYRGMGGMNQGYAGMGGIGGLRGNEGATKGVQNPSQGGMGMMTRTVGGNGMGATAPTAETALSRLNLNKTYANGGTIQAGGTQDLYGTRDDSMTGPALSRDGYGLGRLQAMAEGGATGYKKGGYLDGPGDGMSDSIPATIEGKQPARLADGEFVIPADVVSHLGNGSTKAGSKRLYSMLDKVRHARTGNKKQGKQINPSKFMPA